MTQRRRALVVAIAVCLLVVSQIGWAAEAECREARKHFRKSIWWFETDRWDRAVEEAEQALDRARGCDPDELSFVVPYGRWRYSFHPEVYLGVAAANASWCEGEAIEDRECRVDGRLWRLPKPCERAYLRTERRVCSSPGDEQPRCGPEVDWWLRLARSGVGVELGADGDQGAPRLIGDAATDERALGEACAELWSVAPFLAEVFLRRENRNRVACEVLVGELAALLGGVRMSCEAGR